MLRSYFFASMLLAASTLAAQQPPAPPAPGGVNNAAARPADSTRRGPGGPASGPKAYKDVITAKAVSSKGLFGYTRSRTAFL